MAAQRYFIAIALDSSWICLMHFLSISNISPIILLEAKVFLWTSLAISLSLTFSQPRCSYWQCLHVSNSQQKALADLHESLVHSSMISLLDGHSIRGTLSCSSNIWTSESLSSINKWCKLIKLIINKIILMTMYIRLSDYIYYGGPKWDRSPKWDKLSQMINVISDR